MDFSKDPAVCPNRLPLHQGNKAFKGLAGVVPAVYFPDAPVPGAVCEDHQTPGKKRPVGPAEGHQHAVPPGHRDHLHGCDHGGSLGHMVIALHTLPS